MSKKYSRYRQPVEKKRPKWKSPGAIFIIGMVLYFAISSITLYLLGPMDENDNRPVVIVVARNSTLGTVSDQLTDKDLVRQSWIFYFYCYKNGLAEDIKAGQYTFSRALGVPEMAEMLTQSGPQSEMVTIPEGYTVEQIGQALVNKGFCSESEWEAALQADYAFPFLPAKAAVKQPLEGFLFPDTYVLDVNMTPEKFIEVMLNNFSKKWTESAGAAPADPNQVLRAVTIASMIEREAVLPEERAKIAGVIENRLRKGMPLQIDATVLYALGQHKDVVTLEDLQTDSPYNTYKYPGLPAGPIACPGQASLEAALHPQQHGYYYYVAKGGGAHEFSKTYDEHLQAQKKYQP